MRFEFEFSFVFEFGNGMKYGNKRHTTLYGNIPNTESVYFCLKKYNKFMKLSFIKYPSKKLTWLTDKTDTA